MIGNALRSEGILVLAALDALDKIGGHVAASAALAVIESEEPEPVQAAVACIGANGDPETVAELIGLVGHSSWAVRAETIQMLADRGIQKSVPAILRRLELEQDTFVRDSIVRALKRLED